MDSNEGFVDIALPSTREKGQIWYKIIGDLKAGRPLVILHGGPGLCHDYLLSLTDLATKARPLIFWDQIGSGKSTHLPEKLYDYDFWTEQFFLDQVTAVLTHLNVQHDYDLLGQSWGGMLAASHAAMQPLGLRRLVLSSTPYSSDMWTGTYKRYRDEMPESVRQVLMRTRTLDTPPEPEHAAAVDAFYKRHFMDLEPLPKEIENAYADLELDSTVWKST